MLANYPKTGGDWSDLELKVSSVVLVADDAELQKSKMRFSYLLVHLGVQQGLGGLVYQGGPLIETKKGVRSPPGNDIKQIHGYNFSFTSISDGGHLCPGAVIHRTCSSTVGS